MNNYFILSQHSSMRDPRRYRENVVLQSTTSEDEVGGSKLDPERSLGLLVLLTVPLTWGTYGPVVKYLYEIQPPVPGFLFSAAYYMVASLSLLLLTAVQKDGHDTKTPAKAEEQDSKENSGLPILGGLELGTYLFLGNGLQILGLKTVPSDRAGFLVQLTTVMVPLMHAFLAGTGLTSIPIQTWIACLLAFSGVVVMELDGRDALVDGGIFSSLSAAVNSFSHGDLLIVLAAVVYTLHVVRLGKYAKETTAVKLATAKATTEAILSVGLVLLLMTVGAASPVEGNGLLAYAQETGREITTFFSSITNGIVSGKVPTSVLLPALGAVLWTGWVTCAYTIYAQSFGQRRVSPTDANLIYTLQPIFTALFAWLLLGETLGPAGFAGAALIGSAVYTAAMMTN
jgi:drug/metabolite transporter (DMT)-like permease